MDYMSGMICMSGIKRLAPGLLLAFMSLSSDSCGNSEPSDDPTPFPEVVLLGSPGADTASSLSADVDGNVYLVGSTDSSFSGQKNAGSTDVFVTRLNPDGVQHWLKQFGTPAAEDARQVLLVGGTSVLVLGNTAGQMDDTPSAGDQDIFVMEFDQEGSQHRTHQWGTSEYDRASASISRNEDQVDVVGYSNPYKGEGSQIFLNSLILSSSKWSPVFIGTVANDVALGLSSSGSSDLWISGGSTGEFGVQKATSSAGSFDVIAARLNRSGETTWKEQYGTSDVDGAEDSALDSDGNLYILATSFSDLCAYRAENDGRRDAFLLRLNASGTLDWCTRVTSSINGESAGNALLVEGNRAFIAGWTTATLAGAGNKGGRDLFVASLRFDQSAASMDQVRQWGSNGDDDARDVILYGTDHLLVAGTVGGTFEGYPIQGKSDALVLKVTKEP